MSSKRKARLARNAADPYRMQRARRQFAAGPAPRRGGRKMHLTSTRKDPAMAGTTAPYTLEDCAEINGGPHPDTGAIREGDFVKLVFVPAEPDPEAVAGAESMWVEVTAVNGPFFTGTLDNLPALVPLEPGETVEFTAANIAGIMLAGD